MFAPPLTPAARRHIRLMLREIAPHAARLDADFAALVRDAGPSSGHGLAEDSVQNPRRNQDARARALVSITPAAASRLRSLPRFFEEVEYNGRRLAKLNAGPEEVGRALADFDALVAPVLKGRFAPAREQLRLATNLALNNALYQVRESEAEALLGLQRARAVAQGLDAMLQGVVRALAKAVRARAGRLVRLDAPASGKLAAPLYIEHGEPDERLIDGAALGRRYASYWSYPAGTAVIQLGFAKPYPWLPREMTLLEAAARSCREAIERARLEEEVRRLEAEARRAEEEERRRIGRELHDEVGQNLLFVRLQLEMLERKAPEALAAGLREAREVIEGAIAELRRMVAALSPSVLERLGLAAALRQLAARFRKIHPGELRLRLGVLPGSLPRQVEEIVYRVAQESLQNAAKHSGAGRVMLSLRTSDRSVRLSVADNGAGFWTDIAKKKPMSFGLTGMRERAALIGGTLDVRSAPGKGVRVLLELPRASAWVANHVEDSRTVN
jgi:signal transduction histidine kinase